jgi:alpha-L-fucosidase
MARSIQPWLVINNRIGLPGDFDTPENEVGHFNDKRPWETNATLNHQWSWKPNDTIRSLEECIHMLVVCACGDGNFALNTGPMPDGRIEPQQVERFREMGDWLRKYGESVYGTRGGPWIAPDARQRKQDGYYGKFTIAGGRYWGGSTRKGNTIYLHVLRWPTDAIRLPPLARRIVDRSVLTGGRAEVTQTPAAVTVSVPLARRDAIDTIVKLELDGPATDVPTTTADKSK